MADLATLKARLETLRAQRAKGIRRARFGEDEVEFRHDNEMRDAIADLEAQIARAEGQGGPAFTPVRIKRAWS